MVAARSGCIGWPPPASDRVIDEYFTQLCLSARAADVRSVPTVLEPKRNEILLEVFFAGAVPPEVTARNLDQVAGELRAHRAELEAVGRRLEAIPPRARHAEMPCRRLTLDYCFAFMAMALAWVERAQNVLRARRRGGRSRCQPSCR